MSYRQHAAKVAALRASRGTNKRNKGRSEQDMKLLDFIFKYMWNWDDTPQAAIDNDNYMTCFSITKQEIENWKSSQA